MKKYYWIFAGMLVLALAFLFIRNEVNSKRDIPELLDRKGIIATSAEWLNTKSAIQGLLHELRQHPENAKAKLALAQAYMQEARITGEHPYYYPAALDLLEDVLDEDPENFEALCSKSSVLLSQHHFSDALEPAQEALKINSYNSFVYGLLCDAHVELGNYKEAVEMGDKMVSLRPDLKSYSRISYLREIHGDYAGAIEAMKLAVSSGFPGLEQTAWARVTLGHLYENCGDLMNAELEYKLAIKERSNYAFALAGLGRIEKARKNYSEAIRLTEQAAGIIPEFSFNGELAELYKLAGQPDKAKEMGETVVSMLEEDAESGHYTDREIAYACLELGENEKAIRHAMKELKRRPDNIDANEVVAWTLYRNGEFSGAREFIQKAMKTNSSDPVLLCRAGLIKAGSGEREAGIRLIRKAVEKNPYLSPELMNEAAAYIGSHALTNVPGKIN
jgi:tetratricopeptide (TPR) repeat protein